MPAPIIALAVVQAGPETTRGTAVSATSIVDFTPGSATLVRDPSLIRIRQSGSLTTSHRSYVGKDVFSVNLKGPVSYDRLPGLLSSVLGTATVSGSGTAVWTFGTATISDTADTLKSWTIEAGGKDGNWPAEFQLKGCVANTLTISGKQDDNWQYDIGFLGTTWGTATKTAGLSQATLIDVLGQNTKVYVDSTSAFGTTQKVGNVLSFEVTVAPEVTARYTLDGQRNPYRLAVTGPRTVTAKLVVEWDSITDYNSVHAATAQRVRIVSTGGAIGASNYKAQLDIAGTWDTLSWGEDNGVITEELTLTGQADSSIGGLEIGASVTNTGATLYL